MDVRPRRGSVPQNRRAVGLSRGFARIAPTKVLGVFTGLSNLAHHQDDIVESSVSLSYTLLGLMQSKEGVSLAERDIQQDGSIRWRGDDGALNVRQRFWNQEPHPELLLHVSVWSELHDVFGADAG